MRELEIALDAPSGRDGDVQHRPVPSADECVARARIYRLLAGVFGEEPGPAFLAELRAPAFVERLGEAGVRFDDDFLAPDHGSLEDTLACEYATLFAASGGFPPVESVRLTGRYKQDPHFQVAQAYRRAGFAPKPSRFEVFPDHLGVELSFVAALLERTAEAIERGDAERRQGLDKEIRRFWALHLGRWVRGYCRLVERAADHSFYREMARFLGGFADEEIDALGLRRIDDLDRGRMEVPKREVKVAFDPDEPVCGACPSGSAAASAATVHPLRDLRI